MNEDFQKEGNSWVDLIEPVPGERVFKPTDVVIFSIYHECIRYLLVLQISGYRWTHWKKSHSHWIRTCPFLYQLVHCERTLRLSAYVSAVTTITHWWFMWKQQQMISQSLICFKDKVLTSIFLTFQDFLGVGDAHSCDHPTMGRSLETQVFS